MQQPLHRYAIDEEQAIIRVGRQL